jgi:membrane-associated phospholipid phosphatase
MSLDRALVTNLDQEDQEFTADIVDIMPVIPVFTMPGYRRVMQMRSPQHAVFLAFTLVLGMAASAGAQTDPTHAVPLTATPDQQTSQPPAKPDSEVPQQPATAAPADKPTRGFVSALAHNLLDDVKHLPRMDNAYWLAGGGALALAVHPADNTFNRHLVGPGDQIFKIGAIIGETPTILGAAAATYAIGRWKGSTHAQHLGLDEIEASLLAGGIVIAAKQIVRRDRPLLADGTRQPGFAFPSGHATATFAAATVLQQHLGYRAGLPTYLIASYVAVSRLHDNRHYASDVVFGAATGIVIGRSVTWHGRNFYGSLMPVPGGAGIMISRR